LIDRQQPLSFHFDGKRHVGYVGDTLASALLAAGVKLVGRSFKYHRPRGILTAGSEEPNALVELRTGARREPNTRATVAELFEGLEARSQNRWPSLAFDVGAINSLLSPLLPAGFYYKTFMWPARLWEMLYEPAIRRAAGLGRASTLPDPDTYEKAHAFCDVLVIGGGPAGLSAALSAGRAGARVVLCDEDFIFGGRLNSERREIGGINGAVWARNIVAELASLPGVQLLHRTTVFGAYDHGTVGAIERVSDHLAVPPAGQPRQRFWKIVAKRVVLAAGAIERPLVFGGNDTPGVMMASAVRTYLNRFGVAAGKRIVVFTATDDGWNTARDLLDARIAVEAIVDTRTRIADQLLARIARAGTRVLVGSEVAAVHGGHAVRGVTVRDSAGHLVRQSADVLAVSGGWNPNLALSTHLGDRPEWCKERSIHVPRAGVRGMTVVGAACGSFALADALREGITAGAEAAESAGFRVRSTPIPSADDERTGAAAFWYVADSHGKSFVDFQHDVTREDVALAAREGYRSVELLKRYTTLGMGTDQGKTSNINGLAVLAALTERSIPEVGTTVFRPPFTPVSLGAFAGHHRGRDFRPTRLTSGHRWAEEQGATFVEVGPWLRAQWFTRPGERNWLETVIREVQTVRSGVGICDVSTLGKIDIQGADAASFLDRIYVNTFSTLPPGKVRYGLMLREDGFAMDDGTVARLSADHHLMSTTTANAGKVMQHLEHARQVLWPELDVRIVSVTEQWAQYAVAGPSSRALLMRLFADSIDLSNASFPHLACAELSWRGLPARLFRISFSGELGFELAVPARYGDAALRALFAAGEALNVTPYGTEALGVMRIEKGHLGGNELNGTTTASDLGLARMMSSKKQFIGRILAGRSALANPGRPALVGVRPTQAGARLHAGAHLLSPDPTGPDESDQGYLSSVAFSPMLGSWIGLGFLPRGAKRHGERIRACDPLRNHDLEVEVVSPVFYDPDGSRLQA
jgi:sarcosine oxidase subunit alpha